MLVWCWLAFVGCCDFEELGLVYGVEFFVVFRKRDGEGLCVFDLSWKLSLKVR